MKRGAESCRKTRRPDFRKLSSALRRPGPFKVDFGFLISHGVAHAGGQSWTALLRQIPLASAGHTPVALEARDVLGRNGGGLPSASCRHEDADCTRPVCHTSSGLPNIDSSCFSELGIEDRPCSWKDHAMILQPEGTIRHLQPLSIFLICPPRSQRRGRAISSATTDMPSPAGENPVRLPGTSDDPWSGLRRLTRTSGYSWTDWLAACTTIPSASTTRCSFE